MQAKLAKCGAVTEIMGSVKSLQFLMIFLMFQQDFTFLFLTANVSRKDSKLLAGYSGPAFAQLIQKYLIW